MQNKSVSYSKMVPTKRNREDPFLIENTYLL